MSRRTHIRMVAQAILLWLAFFVIGFPDYYQQYPANLIGVLSVLLSVLISLCAIYLLMLPSRIPMKTRAWWLAIHFTWPFVLLDTLYCGWYLGLGASYLWTHWYLSVFYLTPGLTFPPTAWLLSRALAPTERSRVEA